MQYQILQVLACCISLFSEQPSQSNSKRLSISIPIVRNGNFDRKISSKSFSKWLSKYSHHLFRISRQPKIDSENGSLGCKQDIEKLLESERIQKMIFMQITLQMMIQRVKFRRILGDALRMPASIIPALFKFHCLLEAC